MNVNVVATRSMSAPAAGAAAPPKKDEHGPDLVVQDIVSNPFEPFPGQPVYFDVTVRNQGDRDAGPFNVELTGDAVEDKERVKNGLKAGASTTLSEMGPLQTFEGGQNFYWVEATADSDNEVPETREDNNSSWISVSTQQPPQPPPIPPLPPLPPHPPRVLFQPE